MLKWLPNAYAFLLPHHKGDLVFKGNCVICRRITGAPDPLCVMGKYIDAWGCLYPLHLQLWLQSDGSSPVCTRWISQFQCFFPDSNLAGQSVWAGGATALAEAGAVPNLIMGSRQWTLAAWTSYVQKNSVLLHILLLAWTTHLQPLAFTWTPIISSTYASHVLIPMSSIIFICHISSFYFPTYKFFLKKSSLPSLFYCLTLIHLISPVFFHLNTCKIYVANPSCWEEMEHMVISCSSIGLG